VTSLLRNPNVRGYTYKRDVPIAPGQKLGFRKGVGYFSRGTAAPAAPDALAPLTDAQIQNQASTSVNASTAPILEQIRKMFADRGAQTADQIHVLTDALTRKSAEYAPAATGAYDTQLASQATISQELANRLKGEGSAVSGSLANQLAKINLNPADASKLAGDVTAAGSGAGNAGFAISAADLGAILGKRTAAADYGAKLPGIAGQYGLNALRDQQAQLADQENSQVGQVTSQLPGSISSLVDSLRNREVQKAIARDSGLLNEQKTKATADYQTQTFTERQRHDKATEKAAQDRITAQKQAAADKAATAASKAAATTSTGKQKAFYTTRDKVFASAAKLYKGDTSTGAAPWAKGAKKAGAVTVEDAYAKLWNEYAIPLIGEYGFKKPVLNEMIRRALRTAGWAA
jgi:hypothetical protein